MIITHILKYLPLVLSFVPLVSAQGSREDYERSERLSREIPTLPIFGADPRGEFSSDGRVFTFIDEKEGKSDTWLRLDLESGDLRNALESAVVTPMLRELLKTPAGQSTPRILRLRAHKNEVHFLTDAGAKLFAFAPDTSSLREILIDESPAFRVDDAASSENPRSASPTLLLVANQLDVPIELFWVPEKGDAKSYGTILPGTVFFQPTFAGHRWEARRGPQNVVGRCSAAHRPAFFVIGGLTPETTPNLVRPRVPRRGAPRPSEPGNRSPDKKLEIHFRDHQAILRSLDDNSERILTSDGSQDSPYSGPVYWPNSGPCVVLMRRHRGGDRELVFVESSPRDQVQPKVHRRPYLKPGDTVPWTEPVLIDLRSYSPREVDNSLFSEPYAIEHHGWTKDSSEYRFLVNSRGHQTLRYLAIRPDGTVRTLIEEKSETFVDYAGKFFLHHMNDGIHVLWMSERSGFNHLYRVNLDNGSTVPITSGPWAVYGIEEIDEESQTLILRAGGYYADQNPCYEHFLRVSLKDGTLTPLTDADGHHTLTWSPDGRFYVATYSRVDRPPCHQMRRAADGSLVREFVRADDSLLAKAGRHPVRRFKAPGRDGKTSIHGILVFPSNFDPAGKYPVLECIYAGPHGHHVPKAYFAWNELFRLAELGFVVAQIDGMGTSGRSKAFHDVAWRNLADAGFPDRRLWLTAAAADQPAMDLSRVGIWGGSAGGQNAVRALIDHNDFYHVAVADCGCHDNRMDKIWWNELWLGWPIGPWYESSSNVSHAARLQGKLLLIVGEMDTNVDPASTMQLVDALVRADKDFDLLILPGVGHGAAETAYGRRRRADFFVRHLMHVEPRH